MKQKLGMDLTVRSIGYARRHFLLRTYCENGDIITITPKLRRFIQGWFALAWEAGYKAALRDHHTKGTNANT